MIKIDRKILYIIASLSLICSILTIKETYSKYITSAEGDANLSIASWKIKINDQSILSNTSITNTITPVFTGNENVSDGYIAPKSEGYFDIVIDTTDVDVSYEYILNTSVSEKSAVKDLIVTGYSIDNNPKVEINNNNSTIKNTVLKSSDISIINLRIYIAWDDSLNATMNNADDTLASLSGENASLNVILTFTQIAS